MMQWFFGDCTALQIAILALGAVIIGINKTAIPALGAVVVVLFAQFFPAGVASAAVLPLLCAGDVLAVLYYRRSANWKFVARLLPWALVGLALGVFTVRTVGNSQSLGLWIGGLILFLQILGLVGKKLPANLNWQGSWGTSAFFGILAGFTTQVANAAGPVMAIYLLLMKFSKEEYIGSAAWYFLILNWIKLPLFALDGRLSWQVVHFVPAMLPCLALGSVIGILFLKGISQKSFEWMIRILVTLGALRMIYIAW